MRSVPGSGARAQSARARLRPLCGAQVACASSSGAQVACACTFGHTCVNCHLPLGGFHNYIIILSNARGLWPDNSRSIFEFPENAVDIAPSRHAGRAERNGHGDGSSIPLVERASTLSSYGMGAAYQGSNSPEPAADTRILGRLVLSARRRIGRRGRRGRICSHLVGRHGDF